jgi:molybdenum cofactor biosynthesis protein B
MNDVSNGLRFVVATVASVPKSAPDDVAQMVVDELTAANFVFSRRTTVKREKSAIKEILMAAAGNNEADLVMFVGGVGFGPHDCTCEIVDDLVDRHIEGFGEAYRRLVREDLNLGVKSLLARATAGVCHQSLVVALPRVPEAVRGAIRSLVIPIAATALGIASGQLRPQTLYETTVRTGS